MSKKSSVKRITPLGQNLEDMVKEAKEEMKEYIDEKLKKTEAENKKKLAELDAQMNRRGGPGRGDASPTGSGRGVGRQISGNSPQGRGRGRGG